MRKITVLRDGWKFLKADVSEAQAAALFGQGESISLPHTWNVVDGQDGGNDYHRGRCWYVREVTGKELEGECVFLEINGAAMSADVYFNGQHLLRHEGGYSAFRTDLSALRGEHNVLAIAVSNESNDTVYPTGKCG